jgi:hypothetical protein
MGGLPHSISVIGIVAPPATNTCLISMAADKRGFGRISYQNRLFSNPLQIE